MARVFNSTAELKSYIIQHSKPAVKDVQEKVHQIFEEWLYTFYGEYQPKVTYRTWQVFDSLVKTAVVRKGNGWEAEVYFDAGSLHHPDEYLGQDGWPVYRHWDEDKILSTVMMEGTHGGRADGVAVWREATGEMIPNWRNWMKSALIANGIPVH